MSFVDVVEVGGAHVAPEQMLRTHHRYFWAEQYCRGSDVLEVGCGSGIGLPFLKSIARHVEAGDYSEEVLAICRERHGDIVPLKQFSAEDLPYGDATFDAVILFEAMYYIPDVSKFIAECRRVLRPHGVVLIATANNKLFDFTPSPYFTRYLNVTDFAREFGAEGFAVECFGFISVNQVSLRQKVLRPVKAMASRLNLIPKSMGGKEWLKKLFFGSLVQMP
ncbi:class I SAM-dependent methyltransferase, partial [Devosia sp.]|uniref:class I SAM-dependent methyltransferase n=1 Tax=Devosia sp. TaxID=1871048 RepID=UPI002FC78119